MIFDCKKYHHREKAAIYFQLLITNQKRFELKVLREKRTLNQNSYLHVLFSLYGLNFGSTIEEAKEDIKRDLGYLYVKNGREYLMHTSAMNTKELTVFIDQFRNLSSTRGLYLPRPNEISDDDYNAIESNRELLTGRFDI